MSGWRVGDWTALGWIETVLKVVGVGVGIAALLTASGLPADAPSGARLAQAVILLVLSLGLVAAIADRLAEREVIGIVFILLMNAGHWCMTVAVARDPGLGAFVVAFAALMGAGDLVKLVFLARSGFRVRDVPRGVTFALTGAYAAGYVALILLES